MGDRGTAARPAAKAVARTAGRAGPANIVNTAGTAVGAGVAAAGDQPVTSSVPAARVERTQLPNGLVVCTEFVPGVRSVALGVWVRSASVHESREQMGVSHLLEHLVFKGTARRTARDI